MHTDDINVLQTQIDAKIIMSNCNHTLYNIYYKVCTLTSTGAACTRS